MAGRYRKLFIDSRWRTTGDHNNFSIELPNDIETTATSSVYVASVSFSNTFETITTGVNDKLYCIVARVSGGVQGTPSLIVASITPGKYTGATLAAELQTQLRSAFIDASYSVTFDDNYGKLTFSSSLNNAQFPSDGELRSSLWKTTSWDPYDRLGNHTYSLSDPQSTNSILYFPRPSSFKGSTTTGNIDLVSYREVYLHSNVTTFRTLKCGTGEKDAIARLPIDSDYGFMVVWKHLGPSDAISIPTAQLRNLSFSFRDWAGRLVPIDQPTVIELVFLDLDPYNM